MMNPAEILSATIHHGQEKIKRPFLEKAVLGFIGGAMISFGYLLYIRVVASVAEELGSLASLIGASVFPIGLIVILLLSLIHIFQIKQKCLILKNFRRLVGM